MEEGRRKWAKACCGEEERGGWCVGGVMLEDQHKRSVKGQAIGQRQDKKYINTTDVREDST